MPLIFAKFPNMDANSFQLSSLLCRKDGSLGNVVLHYIEFNREQTHTKEQTVSAHSF